MPILYLLSSTKAKYQLILVLALMVLFVTLLTIWSMNRLSTVGEQIAQLERTKNAIQLENELLEKKIAERFIYKVIINLSWHLIKNH
jgi:cytochrome oxidase assembly protein ShyY1